MDLITVGPDGGQRLRGSVLQPEQTGFRPEVVTSTLSQDQELQLTLFFLLVGAGGLISFCRILRHMRVMFSTTTGVLMFTDIRKRLRAAKQESRG